MLSDRGAKFAFDLLMAARQSRQRRSRNMFRFLISNCINNGNVIAASLLYEIQLKDWQAREPTANSAPENETYFLQHPNTPFPTHGTLNKICLIIKDTLASGKSDTDSPIAFKASLQALANLATMLNDQVFADRKIKSLLNVLRKCPRVPDMVWIYDSSGNPKRIVAYKYFHDVLYRFILSLPTHPPALDERKKMLPPLNLITCNVVLRYALKQRNSASLAETILYHMIHKRHQPLQPNAASLKIILTSGALLHSEIADFALSKLDKDWKLLTAPIDSKSPSHS